jgi:D-glycero-alpha-D-manno-heptose 1-phosphate guanylyltransferase
VEVRSFGIDPWELTAVVLAGGFGTRVRHLLPGIPKPMAVVGGKPFLEWVIRYLARQGIRNVVLSTGYLSEVIAGYFLRHPVEGISVCCIPEAEPLGTAGGFLNAVRRCGHTSVAWLVLNGDSLAFADLAELTTRLQAPDTAGVLAGCAVPDASRYGTLQIGSGGELLGFAEKHPGRGVINAGTYLLKATLLRKLPAKRPLSFERDVFPALIAQGALLKVCVTTGPFLDIGTPESLPQAEAFVTQNQGQFWGR